MPQTDPTGPVVATVPGTPTVYLDAMKAPLDTRHGSDIGDIPGTKLPEEWARRRNRVAFAHGSALHDSMILVYTEMVQLGSRGPKAKAVKRALSVAGHLNWTRFTELFGKTADLALRAFQAEHGLKADGQAGPDTIKQLAPFFDAFGVLLYTGHPPASSAEAAARQAIVAYALWGYNFRELIHYDLHRPMDHLAVAELHHLPETEDCSTFATKAYRFGGGPDPNGHRPAFDGGGFTGDQRNHGKLVAITAAQPGDLVHYDGPQHVAVYIGNRRVVSHGSEGGPYLLGYDYRTPVQIRNYF